MQNMRYRDREYLMEYDLDAEIFEKYAFKVKDIIPLRNVYLLKTDKGDKIFKKIDFSVEELKFIFNVLKYVEQNFKRIMSYEKTKDGELYITWHGSIYCVINRIKGRECEFTNPVDICISGKGLGELHKASEGYKCNIDSRYLCGKLIDNFKRRLEEVNFFKCIVEMYENRNEFDEIFLSNVDYYTDKISESIKKADESQYFKLCSEEDKVVICHHDLAHHNIIINDEEAYFIDFDYAVFDLKIHDLCNLINKSIKNFAFDSGRAESIINSYLISNTLSKRELKVLHSMLIFPEDFYNVCKDYYTRRKKWDYEVFLYRLKRKVDYKEDTEEFLCEYERKFLK